jgi:hypothetical protein
LFGLCPGRSWDGENVVCFIAGIYEISLEALEPREPRAEKKEGVDLGI